MSGFANAITGNPQTSDRKSVGLIIFYSISENGKLKIESLSSGVLISPTVMLTAAHAVVSNNFVVTFEQAPCFLDSNKEVTFEKNSITTFTGEAKINEYYLPESNKNGMPFMVSHDVALLKLNEDVPTSVVEKYGDLPEQGYADTLNSKKSFELFGYGVQEHLSPRNVGLEKTWTGTLERNSAEAKVISGNFAWSNEFIRCSANPGQGKGGIAFGDSGGPVFDGDIVIALNSYVTNANCVGETYHSRIDLPDILSWIKSEVPTLG